MIYRFGEFELEPAQSRLSRGDAIVPVQPKVHDALHFFLDRAGQLLSREDLLDGLWPDTIVNEEALTQIIRKLRRALGDNPRDPQYVATVPKRGYRFVAPVELITAAPPSGPTLSVPAWFEAGAAPPPPPPPGDGGLAQQIDDLFHFRQLIRAGARLVIASRFALGRRVGVADSSSVYQADDLVLGQRVALKMLHQPDREGVVRFQREVRILQALDHPGIVPYVAHGTTDTGLCFLATRWVDGEPLTEWLAELGPLPLDRFLPLARRLAETVAFAHEQKVIHRALEPDHVLIGGDDGSEALVLDFGLARFTQDARVTEEGALLGTLGYIAPEQAQGQTDIDSRADVYALGCIYFQALCGRLPHSGSALEILRKLVFADAPSLRGLCPELPAPLAILVDAMLARDREARPPDAAAVARALARTS